MDEGLTAAEVRAHGREGPSMSESEARTVQRAWQQRVASEWLGERCHLLEIAGRHGLDVQQAMKTVAFGLLAMGEVSLLQMYQHGFLKERRPSTLGALADKHFGRAT